MNNKKTKNEPGCWPRRPGYNSLLGYLEGKEKYTNTKYHINEVVIDRNVKSGLELNK